jgi:hypothetical protein
MLGLPALVAIPLNGRGPDAYVSGPVALGFAVRDIARHLGTWHQRGQDMADTWTTHHKGTVGGRRVEVKTYSEGGYRVSTTAGETSASESYRDGSSFVGGVVVSKGFPIDIDGETLDEIRNYLAVEGFDPGQIEEIVGRFPS